MPQLADNTVDLVVTSPPYPMIKMWDSQFSSVNPRIGEAIADENADQAFNLMHSYLDSVWRECLRVLRPGGLACINIADATRTIRGEFRLFSNHSRVLQAMNSIGFSTLPDILWRKPTNSPNKFLGSGMLPTGAYVTYEHEYILIFRKPGIRRFQQIEQKKLRTRSAFFWEERNVWFSDLWTNLTGTKQDLPAHTTTRFRSGAFPFELPFRLIQMYSLIGDTVIDPFLGTGTTSAAALSTGRSSIGIEMDDSLNQKIRTVLETAVPLGRKIAQNRLKEHMIFVSEREALGRPCQHHNRTYGIPVMTRQETDIELIIPSQITAKDSGSTYVASHEPIMAEYIAYLLNRT